MSEPTDTVQSQLSAFVDNELPQDETELLARRLSRDTDLQHALSRYLLIGEALRAPSQARVSRDFSTRVAAAIEQDKVARTGEVTAVRPVRSWVKPAIGMTLAASVAAVSVLSVSHLQSANGVVPAAQLAVTSNSTNEPASRDNSYVVPVATTTPSAPISATRLTNYVVAHSEFTSPLGRRNMLTGLVTSDQKSEETVENVEDSGASQ
ncbi:MAG TPA: RseA family anti-sigma factor [Steroidobacteraceae bacterium]|nr:RseA family anti-sigma factor [Steroidobacteraceae bacterium]